MSLSPRRAWIEIDGTNFWELPPTGRSPHGERGLKCGVGAVRAFAGTESLSPRRAWIEIYPKYSESVRQIVALPTESVD